MLHPIASSVPLRHLCLAILLVGCNIQLSKAQNGFTFDQLAYPFATQTTTLASGITIAYADEGKGKQTLIFVHGLGSYLAAWKKNIPALAAHYRCIAIDLPGYGKSSKSSDYACDMQFYASVLADFVKQLQLTNVVLVGHSMGGQISLTAALNYPELFDKLVLIAPAGLETFQESQGALLKQFTQAAMIKATTDDKIMQNLALGFYENKTPDEALFMANDRIAIKQAPDFDAYCQCVERNVAGMLDQPVAARLPEIKQPVLLVFGNNDALIPNKLLNPQLTVYTVVEQALEDLSGAAKHILILMPQAGHMVQFEQAERLNKDIIDFVGK
ncbi:MAG TPA: alpha/beta hydrolase [Microscillaceae bacterium]|jgi:pimeloyl-ACP methyl ester carboxylesterase|nr:alpha/beta hydrolase [Microscillaceae bacterium]